MDEHNPKSHTLCSLLYVGIRVLIRMMAECKENLGFKLRFTNQRTRAKSLELCIFYAKNAADLWAKFSGCYWTYAADRLQSENNITAG